MLRSWAGILDVFEHPVVLAETLWDWRQWSDQWDSSDVLVLDEISMVDCDLIEKVGKGLLLLRLCEWVYLGTG